MCTHSRHKAEPTHGLSGRSSSAWTSSRWAFCCLRLSTPSRAPSCGRAAIQPDNAAAAAAEGYLTRVSIKQLSKQGSKATALGLYSRLATPYYYYLSNTHGRHVYIQERDHSQGRVIHSWLPERSTNDDFCSISQGLWEARVPLL